jgi:PAS domain S-box-containing protein
MAQNLNDGSIPLLAAFEVAGVGVCFTDAAGSFVRVNPAFCKMLGYRVGELLGQPWSLIATPALTTNAAAFYAGLLTDDSSTKEEWDIRRKDGTIASALVSCKPIRRADGEVLLVSTFTDIAERKAAELEVQRLNRELEMRIAERTAELSQRLQQIETSEAALRSSEMQYRQVFDNVSEGIIVVQDGHIVLANPRAEKLVGYDLAYMKTRPLTDVIHPDDQEMVMERYEKRLQGLPVESNYSFRAVRSGGDVIWLELSAVLIEWHGRRAVLAFITDVTESRTLAEDLKFALDERETILENSVVGIAFLNADGRLMWGNQAIGEMFGAEVLETRGGSLEAYYPSREDYLRIGAAVSAAVRAGRAYSMELQMKRGNGELFWAQLTGKAVNPKDLSRGTVWTVLDITRRRQAEEDIRRALAQQRELNELKSRFVSMTSHEYRTPLATILSSAELLRDYAERMPKEEVKGVLSGIEIAVRHMTEMLDDILLIGRVDAGRVEFVPTPVNLHAFTRELATEAAQAAAPDGADLDRIDVTCACMAPTALVDERLLRHILGNLLSNAFKYSPAGGRVVLACSADGDRLRFEVRDQGIGIPEQDLPLLFDTFHRASKVGSISGTGLGMAIVKRAVELHGGEIAVVSHPGQGTTFSVLLPWRPAKEN